MMVTPPPALPMTRPRLHALILPLVLLIAACASSGPKGMTKKQKVDYYFENGLRWYELGYIDQAQDQAERGLEVDPGNERFLLLKGRCMQRRDRPEDVVAAEQLFRNHPAQHDYRIHLGLAGCLERKGLFLEEGARQIESGEKYTTAPDPAARAVEMRMQAGVAWEESSAEYLEAEELYSGTFEALNGSLRLAALLERYEESLMFANKLLAAIAVSNKLYKAELAAKEEQGESTVNTRKTLLDNEDLEVEVRLHAATLLHKDGEFAQALAQLDEVLTLQSNRAEVHARRGQILVQLERYARGRSALERFLQLSDKPFDHPAIREAYDQIAVCNQNLGSQDG